MSPLRSFRRARTAVAAAAAVALVAVGGACSLLITDTLPAFICMPNGAEPPCLSGQICARSPTDGLFRCTDSCTKTGCGLGYGCAEDSGICIPLPDASQPAEDSGASEASVADAGEDAPTQDAVADAPSTWTDAAIGCHSFGCPCATVADCDAGTTCVDRVAATKDIWDALGDAAPPGDAGGVCMEPCCTSSDCPSYGPADGGAVEGRVCFATGSGGNYCVPPGWLPGRGAVAINKPGGSACGGDAGGCRSGLCLDSGVCADTCCDTKTSTECASSGDYCRFGAFPGTGFDTHVTANCTVPTTPGTFIGGNTCMFNSDCRSNLCMQGRCADACRSRDSCQTSGTMTRSQTCNYVSVGNGPTPDLGAACAQLPGPGGGILGDGGDGAPCRTTTDCARGYCAFPTAGTLTGTCLAVCFFDTDQTSNSDCPLGERCRPQPVFTGGATFSVLGCGN